MLMQKQDTEFSIERILDEYEIVVKSCDFRHATSVETVYHKKWWTHMAECMCWKVEETVMGKDGVQIAVREYNKAEEMTLARSSNNCRDCCMVHVVGRDCMRG